MAGEPHRPKGHGLGSSHEPIEVTPCFHLFNRLSGDFAVTHPPLHRLQLPLLDRHLKGRPTAPARKIVIKDLYIRNGQVQITHPLLQGKLLSTALPTTRLTNIGQANGGVTPTVIADLLIKTIVINARNVATQDLMKNISALPGVVKGTPANILNQVNGLIGK